MSNPIERKKLTLNRETIRTLDTVELGEVNGGFTPVVVGVFTASVRFCRYSKQIVGGAVSAYKATKWAVEHAPAGNPDNPPSFVGATA